MAPSELFKVVEHALDCNIELKQSLKVFFYQNAPDFIWCALSHVMVVAFQGDRPYHRGFAKDPIVAWCGAVS